VDIKHDFSKGCFAQFIEAERLIGNVGLIPDYPGVYAVKSIHGNQLFYIGQAKGKVEIRPRSIQDRFKKEHFKKRARGSALRRHIALELSIPLFKDHTGHNTVDAKYEDRISEFMEKELSLSFITAKWGDVDAMEKTAIMELKPKWNIQHSNI
jgi:hypothetical protein